VINKLKMPWAGVPRDDFKLTERRSPKYLRINTIQAVLSSRSAKLARNGAVFFNSCAYRRVRASLRL